MYTGDNEGSSSEWSRNAAKEDGSGIAAISRVGRQREGERAGFAQGVVPLIRRNFRGGIASEKRHHDEVVGESVAGRGKSLCTTKVEESSTYTDDG